MGSWRRLKGAEGAPRGRSNSAWLGLGVLLGALALSGCSESKDSKGEGLSDGVKLGEKIAPPPPVAAPSSEDTAVERAHIPAKPPPRAALDIEDTTLIPGRSVGPVDHLSSLDDLKEMYGEEALSEQVITLQDGSKQLGTRIRRVKGEEITVIWWDDNRRTLREARDPSPKWATPEGIHRGMTLAELEEAIGPFQVFGFGWEDGGNVKLKGTTAAAYHNKLHLRMVPTKRYPDVLARLSGDIWYDSSDKNLKTIQPVIRDIVISLEPEGRL